MKRTLEWLQQIDVQKVLQSLTPISTVVQGHVLDVLKNIPDKSVQSVITSPPYWGLREYGTELQVWGGESACHHKWSSFKMGKKSGGNNEWSKTRYMRVVGATSIESTKGIICNECGAWQGSLGLEPTPDMYIDHLVAIFSEIHRVLRDDGVCWLNIDDTYANGAIGRSDAKRKYKKLLDKIDGGGVARKDSMLPVGNLHLIPAKLAIKLQSSGWRIRDIIAWVKMWQDDEGKSDGTVMPGGAGRFTSAWEYIFQLTKSSKYFFDLDAVRTTSRSNLRNVFRINIQPYTGAHIAPFPEELVSTLLLTSTSGKCCPECKTPYVRENKFTFSFGWRPGCTCFGEIIKQKRLVSSDGKFKKKSITMYKSDGRDVNTFPCVVLDPFAGSGTVGQVALRHRRSFIGIELNPVSVKEAEERISSRWVGKRGRGK